MKLIECLRQLPPDMPMIDLVAFDRHNRQKTVEDIIASLSEYHANEENFEVREFFTHYGTIKKRSIGVINGFNLYIEV